jgi:hypothetical protein
MSDETRTTVRERYGKAALDVIQGEPGECGCGCGCGPETSGGTTDPITADLYDQVTSSSLPVKAVLASLRCGNPTALAELKEGEAVLDSGSGGESTFSFRPGELDPPGRPTAWT